MEQFFQVGDRVVSTIDYPTCGNHGINKGDAGVVICRYGGSVGIQFDKYINGHDCALSGTPGKLGFCWYLNDFDLELESPLEEEFLVSSESELDSLFR